MPRKTVGARNEAVLIFIWETFLKRPRKNSAGGSVRVRKMYYFMLKVNRLNPEKSPLARPFINASSFLQNPAVPPIFGHHPIESLCPSPRYKTASTDWTAPPSPLENGPSLPTRKTCQSDAPTDHFILFIYLNRRPSPRRRRTAPRGSCPWHFCPPRHPCPTRPA